MKLASTYQRFYFVLLCLLLTVGFLAYYFSIRYVLINQLDNDLKIEQQEFLDFVQLHDSLPAPSRYRDQQLQWFESPGLTMPRCFESINGRDPYKEVRGPIRRLVFSQRARHRDYLVMISKSLDETEDLLWLMLWVTVGSFLVLLGGLYIGNRFLLERIWQPFYQILDYLGNFSLAKPIGSKPVTSRIDEFVLLHSTVDHMTEKMQRDFLTLQQFTDHAAHEMQTPLAIIKTKLDLMMQHPGLDRLQYEQMQQLHLSVGRLSRLNQSLLLLARIENRQYLEKESVALKRLIEEKLDLWQDWIREQQLLVFQQLDDDIVWMHPFLAESLVNNLLSNAVRHTSRGGELHVFLTKEAFVVQNSGPSGPLDQARLFQRFQKQVPSEGVGLGLAIVKEIAELSGMTIRYSYSEGRHTFTLLCQG